MRLIPGTRLELVRCTSCEWEQILNGWGCGRCGGKVEELAALPALAPKSLAPQRRQQAKEPGKTRKFV